MILEVGFNGIADITWVEEFPKKMRGKLADGKQCTDMWLR